MIIENQISVNFKRPTINIIHAKQGDLLTRKVSIKLFDGNDPFLLDEGLDVVAKYQKSDNTYGFYSKLPNGDSASSYVANTNLIDLILAPQSLTCAGTTKMSISLIDSNENVLQTFSFDILVEKTEGSDGNSEDYVSYPPLASMQEKIDKLTQQTDRSIEELYDSIGGVEQSIAGLTQQTGRSIEELYDYIGEVEEDLAGLDQQTDRSIEELYDYIDEISQNFPLSILNGKVCTDASKVKNNHWELLEPAVILDAPYTQEYGWQCAVADNTTDLYEWIYRCFFEGFSVPYRTIDVEGVEHYFDTELTKRNTEWYAEMLVRLQITPELNLSANGVTPDQASYLCIPLVQFDKNEDALIHAFARVRNDNPLLCCPPIGSNSFIKDASGKVLYAYCIFQTEKTVEKITSYIEQSTNDVVGLVDHYCGILPGDNTTEDDKKKIAKVIHDYIVINSEPSVLGATVGNALINPWKATLFAVLDPDQRALCDGYSQAFNYFARMYGIVSLVMTGELYVENDEGQLYHEGVGHAWNISSFTAEYGKELPSDPAQWTAIDVYWDEPLHEKSLGRGDPGGRVFWKYFCKPENIFIKPIGVEYSRIIETDTSYGSYPFDGEPTAVYDDHGTNEYEW